MSAPLKQAIAPRSDQLNYDDLMGGVEMVITVTGVKITPGDQPISISIDGSPKFYRPSKTCARVMAAIWGMDEMGWVGKSARLYGDPSIKFGPQKVGGIRISELSHMGDKPITLSLTSTRGQRTLTVIRPLLTGFESARSAASKGTEAFRVWWNSPEGKAVRPEVQPRLKELQDIAAQADAAPPEEPPEPDPVEDDLGYQPTMEERLRAAAEAQAAAKEQEREFTREPEIEDADVVGDEREPGEE
jgi:hypothetical protein